MEDSPSNGKNYKMTIWKVLERTGQTETLAAGISPELLRMIFSLILTPLQERALRHPNCERFKEFPPRPPPHFQKGTEVTLARVT